MAENRVLVVGVGGGGSRLLDDACRILDADCVTVSTNPEDASIWPHIRINCGNLANPSVQSIRSSSQDALERMSGLLAEYDTVVMLANLAGRSGAALAPALSGVCSRMHKTLASFCIMPFRFEKDKLFHAGVSLRRVRADSDSLVVLDNDSLLECNPDLSMDACRRVGNDAFMCVLDSFGRARLPGQCIVSAGPQRETADESLRDSLKMLYSTTRPGSVRRSVIYVAGDVPVGVIDSVSRLTAGITDAPVDVVSGGNGPRVVLVSAVDVLGKFEGYDPLGVIPDMIGDEYPDGMGDAALLLHPALRDIE